MRLVLEEYLLEFIQKGYNVRLQMRVFFDNKNEESAYTLEVECDNESIAKWYDEQETTWAEERAIYLAVNKLEHHLRSVRSSYSQIYNEVPEVILKDLESISKLKNDKAELDMLLKKLYNVDSLNCYLLKF